MTNSLSAVGIEPGPLRPRSFDKPTVLSAHIDIYPRRHHGWRQGEIFDIWTLQIALKWPSQALTEASYKNK